jgi:hypothetical protein
MLNKGVGSFFVVSRWAKRSPWRPIAIGTLLGLAFG